MKPNIFTKSELMLAWGRLLNDSARSTVFANHSYEMDIYKQNLDTWIDEILLELNNGTFSPSPMLICNVPKVQYGIRPGGYLTFKDRLVYNVLLGKFLFGIKVNLEWSDGLIDFANQIKGNIFEKETTKNPFTAWSSYRNAGISYLDKEFQYVAFTDITGFYENIDPSRLLSDLRQIGEVAELTVLLGKCLKRWGHGLPQGYVASDILSKIYLNSVDQKMNELGYTYTRYSDDFRIFCRTKSEAKKAIMDLNLLIRERGLNLQTAKTEILNLDKAKEKIEGVDPLIKSTIDDFADEIVSEIDPTEPFLTGFENDIMKFISNPYTTVFDLENLAFSLGDEGSRKVFNKTFKKYFLSNKKFEHTLFRFLLVNLGKYHDPYALDYCLKSLAEIPEETLSILKYIENTETENEAIHKMAEFIWSDDAIYDYQNYLILDWYSRICNRIKNDSLIRYARKFAFNGNTPYYLRSVSRKIIGLVGNESDLDKLVEYYPNLFDIEKAETMISVLRVEKARRNSFYNEVKDDNCLNIKAFQIVKK